MGPFPNGSGGHPQRRTSHLRTGRVSVPGGRYFVTAVTKNREPVFTAPSEAERARHTLLELDAAGDFRLFAATVMPDHVHLLFELGPSLAVGRVCAKFKTLARDHGRTDWCWLQDQYEHRLRANDDLEHYGLYIFMNPYRAGLLPLDKVWPHWICPTPTLFRFLLQRRSDGTPQPEWGGICDNLAGSLSVGE